MGRYGVEVMISKAVSNTASLYSWTGGLSFRKLQSNGAWITLPCSEKQWIKRMSSNKKIDNCLTK